MDCSTPGFPVHHWLPQLAETHVHPVSDAIQPSHPLSSPSPAFYLSQHPGLFQWVSSSNQVAKLLELQLQHQSFQRIFWIDFLWIDWFDLASKGLSRVFSNNTIQKHQFFGAFFIVQLSEHAYPASSIDTPEEKKVLKPFLTFSKVNDLLKKHVSSYIILFP